MNLQPINASASPEAQINENFETLDCFSVYGKDPRTTENLTWVYYGGRWSGFSITGGIANAITLTDDDDNYLVVAKATGVLSASNSSTNWDNTNNYARVYKITAAGGVVTTTEDHRGGLYGIFGPGNLGIPFNSQSAAYTAVLADDGLLHPSADTTARTFTIPANASVAYPLFKTLVFVNEHGAGLLTIAITSDTMYLAGDGSTGSRTLAADGIAIAIKITATEWLIAGTGLL